MRLCILMFKSLNCMFTGREDLRVKRCMTVSLEVKLQSELLCSYLNFCTDRPSKSLAA